MCQSIGTFDEVVERIIENQEEESNTLLVEHLQSIHQRPYHLNRCNAEDLNSLQLLSDGEISSILHHREQYHGFISLLELQQCDISLERIQLLTWFVFLPNAQRTNGEPKSFNHEIYLGFQIGFPTKDGFTKPDDQAHYTGNSIKHTLRYRGVLNHGIRIAFTAEKDAGEPFFRKNNRYGYDFYSGHLLYKSANKLKTLILGDFTLGFGQGLVVGNGLSTGKSSLVLQTKKSLPGLRAFRSVNEQQFLRGIGGQFEWHKLHASVYFSRRKKDANLIEVDSSTEDNPIQRFSSLLNSGYHRTPDEIADKKTITETQTGYYIKFPLHRLHVGHSLSYVSFSGIQTPSTKLYNRYRFRGRQFIKSGLDYNFHWNSILFFGEFASSDFKSISHLEGVLISLSKRMDLSLFHRYLNRAYHSYQSSVFSESASGKNENGTYVGASIKLGQKSSIQLYADQYHFPWLTLSTKMPTRGVDYVAELRYKKSKKTHFYLRFKYERKEKFIDDETVQRTLLPNHLIRTRSHLELNPTPAIRLRARWETSVYNTGNSFSSASFGNLLYQDIKYSHPRHHASLIIRFSMTRIDNFENRIYTYENDVPLSYSIPFYQHNAMRCFALFSFRLNGHLDFWLRFARDFKSSDDGFGSGLDHSSGNQRTDLKCQVRIRI